jgi:hypothetical protein
LPVPQRFRLGNIGGVTTELKRVYRLAHNGKMTWQDAGCAARVLRELRFCLESNDIEGRIVAIEELMKANGSGLPRGRPANLGARFS